MQTYTRLQAKRTLRIAAAIIAILVIGFLLRGVLLDLLGITFGATVIAFLLQPLAQQYERKLSRHFAALCAFLTILVVLLGAAWLLLPSLVRELIDLAELLPQSIDYIKSLITRASDWLETHLAGIELPSPSLGETKLPELALGTINLAGSVADAFYRLSLMIVLAYFLLCDRAHLMIRLELLIPHSMRRTAVRMGNAVCRELRLYLRGQFMIALAVGALSSIGLILVGVRSALALGILVGILNMVPYFGPVLGGIPAVLMALGEGWQPALLTVGVLCVVQQLDSMFISPRIMGNLTGVSPATVLLAIFAGSSLSGILGMLLALPVVMTCRTLFRVFVQRHENI